MKNLSLIAITLVALVFVSFVGCSPKPVEAPEPAAPALEPAAPAPEPAAPAPEPAAPAPEPAAPAPAPAPETAPATPAPAADPAAAPGAAIDPTTIVGTTWEAGGYRLAFNADGKLKVNDAIDGTWAIEGNKLKAAAMGQNIEADIQGDKLLYEGQALARVQK